MEETPFVRFRRTVEQSQLKVANARGDTFQMECPSHADKTPSVTVTYREGKVLVHCFAGCDTRDVVDKLGLTMEDLFDVKPDEKNYVVVARYRYTDGQGKPVFTKLRLFPKSFRITDPTETAHKMPEGMSPWLFHADRLRAAAQAGEPLWLVEGEADVISMEAMGGVATTQPFGAGKGAWKQWHTNLVKSAGFTEARIVVDLDETTKDGKNPGRDYAFEVRNALRAAGVKVSLWRAKSGKDATDHLKAGFGLPDFRRYVEERQRPAGITHATLMQTEFKPIVFAVEDILPQGLALLGGPPKLGKSLIALNMAMAVGSGPNGLALSKLKVTPGRVLYIGMEDSMRRLKNRILAMEMGNTKGLENIEFQPIESMWPGGLEGMAMMEEWAEEDDDPRLVVIDTLARAEPEMDESRDRYRAEYALTLRYKTFADRHDLTVLMIHHDKKGEETDWLSRFSGSRGLTGGVDTLLFLEGARGEPTATLRVTGRDIEGDDLPLRRIQGRPGWVVDHVTAPATPEGIMDKQRTHPELEPLQDVIIGALNAFGGRANERVIFDQFPEDDREIARAALNDLVYRKRVKAMAGVVILAQ